MLIKFDGEFGLKPNRNLIFIEMFKGGVDEDLDFAMGPNTSAYLSCAARLNGELFVFGGSGSSNEKQVTFLKYLNDLVKQIISDQ